MAACRDCNSRLQRPVGSSGFCNPCYITVRIEKLVFTRCPPVSADQLFHFLRKVSDVVEGVCEKYESDRTAGLVAEDGAPIPGKGREPGPDPFAQGIHLGTRDPGAGSSSVPVKKEAEAEKDQEKEPVVDAKPEQEKAKRRRRRTRSRSRRDRTRSRRRKSKGSEQQSRGKSPVHTEEETAPVASGEETFVGTLSGDENEAVDEEKPEVKDDDESDRKYSLSRTAKPSARKPLPRRPRTPSPGYYQEDSSRAPRWKGYKHVLRGQYYSNRGSGRGKNSGKGWHRR